MHLPTSLLSLLLLITLSSTSPFPSSDDLALPSFSLSKRTFPLHFLLPRAGTSGGHTSDTHHTTDNTKDSAGRSSSKGPKGPTGPSGPNGGRTPTGDDNAPVSHDNNPSNRKKEGGGGNPGSGVEPARQDPSSGDEYAGTTQGDRKGKPDGRENACKDPPIAATCTSVATKTPTHAGNPRTTIRTSISIASVNQTPMGDSTPMGTPRPTVRTSVSGDVDSDTSTIPTATTLPSTSVAVIVSSTTAAPSATPTTTAGGVGRMGVRVGSVLAGAVGAAMVVVMS